MFPVLLRRPMRWTARPEPVAVVRPTQPVVCRATVSGPAEGEQLTIDLDGGQHWSGPALDTLVDCRNGEPVALVTVRLSLHGASIDGWRPNSKPSGRGSRRLVAYQTAVVRDPTARLRP